MSQTQTSKRRSRRSWLLPLIVGMLIGCTAVSIYLAETSRRASVTWRDTAMTWRSNSKDWEALATRRRPPGNDRSPRGRTETSEQGRSDAQKLKH